MTLLLAVDDATGTAPHALFQEQEDTRGYLSLLQGIIERRGVPMAVYTDGHAVFQPRRCPSDLSQVPRKGPSTQWSRALQELGVTQILAHSPQAKGRVERANGTFQDRLVAELRLVGASTLEEANQALSDFLPRFNQRFRVPAAQPESAYRPVEVGRDGAADGRTAPAGLRHPPRRTGLATFTASGSPSDESDPWVGNICFSAIFVGFIHPFSGVVRFVPHSSDCPPSPCGRLSRPRTTTRALPHVRHWPKAGLLRCRRAGRASQVRLGCVFAPS